MRKLGSSIHEFSLQTGLGSIVNLIVNTEWIFSHIGSSSDEGIFCIMFSYIYKSLDLKVFIVIHLCELENNFTVCVFVSCLCDFVANA